MANKKKGDLRSMIENIFNQDVEPARRAARTSLAASVQEFLGTNVEEISGHYEPLSDMFSAYKKWVGNYFVPGTTGADFIFAIAQNNLKIGISVIENMFNYNETVVVQDVILKNQTDIEMVIGDGAEKKSDTPIQQSKPKKPQKKEEKPKASDSNKQEEKNPKVNSLGTEAKPLEEKNCSTEEGEDGGNNG